VAFYLKPLGPAKLVLQLALDENKIKPPYHNGSSVYRYEVENTGAGLVRYHKGKENAV
jgi:hypothetical protein